MGQFLERWHLLSELTMIVRARVERQFESEDRRDWTFRYNHGHACTRSRTGWILEENVSFGSRLSIDGEAREGVGGPPRPSVPTTASRPGSQA